MKSFPNILLIGGIGQNVGKSTMVSDLLKKFSSENIIYTIKTSNHFHQVNEQDIIFQEVGKFQVLKESMTDGKKDSSLFLQSGASKSFFIMAEDEYLEYAFLKVIEKIEPKGLIICESAVLRKFIKPATFVYLKNEDSDPVGIKKEMLNLANLKVTNYFSQKLEVLNKIKIENNSWLIQED